MDLYLLGQFLGEIQRSDILNVVTMRPGGFAAHRQKSDHENGIA
jgi:hypothetical protein